MRKIEKYDEVAKDSLNYSCSLKNRTITIIQKSGTRYEFIKYIEK